MIYFTDFKNENIITVPKENLLKYPESLPTRLYHYYQYINIYATVIHIKINLSYKYLILMGKFFNLGYWDTDHITEEFLFTCKYLGLPPYPSLKNTEVDELEKIFNSVTINDQPSQIYPILVDKSVNELDEKLNSLSMNENIVMNHNNNYNNDYDPYYGDDEICRCGCHNIDYGSLY
jgi:hypothetical protein